jgi:hypothetical protein
VALAARDPDRTPASPERLLYAKRAFERLVQRLTEPQRREITHVALDFRPVWLMPVLLGRPLSPVQERVRQDLLAGLDRLARDS